MIEKTDMTEPDSDCINLKIDELRKCGYRVEKISEEEQMQEAMLDEWEDLSKENRIKVVAFAGMLGFVERHFKQYSRECLGAGLPLFVNYSAIRGAVGEHPTTTAIQNGEE